MWLTFINLMHYLITLHLFEYMKNKPPFWRVACLSFFHLRAVMLHKIIFF